MVDGQAGCVLSRAAPGAVADGQAGYVASVAASLARSANILAGFGFDLVGCVQVRIARMQASSPDPNPFSFSQFSLRFASPCSLWIVKLVQFLRRLQTGQITTVRPARRGNPILVCLLRKNFRFLFVFYLQIVWANAFLDWEFSICCLGDYVVCCLKCLSSGSMMNYCSFVLVS